MVKSAAYLSPSVVISPSRLWFYGERKQNYAGLSFWARGYFVPTVGRDERVIREYIRNQEQEDQRKRVVLLSITHDSSLTFVRGLINRILPQVRHLRLRTSVANCCLC